MGNLKLSRYWINYDDDCTRFITKLYAVKRFIKKYIYIYSSNRKVLSTSIWIFRIDRRIKQGIKSKCEENSISFLHKGRNERTFPNANH